MLNAGEKISEPTAFLRRWRRPWRLATNASELQQHLRKSPERIVTQLFEQTANAAAPAAPKSET